MPDPMIPRWVAQNRYDHLIREGLNLDHQAKYYEVKDQRFLGDQEFLEGIESKRITEEPVLFEIPLGDIVIEVSKTVGIIREAHTFFESRPKRSLRTELGGLSGEDVIEIFN